MVSSVTEGHIEKLRGAGYLSEDIAHRLPAKKHIIPTPEPNERVVFIPHFLRGLGFPLHPFVCGLTFYYGPYVQSHPKSVRMAYFLEDILNIATFG